MLPSRGMISTPFEPPAFKPGTYRHYKGNLYEAVGLACHEETHAWLVIYKPLYIHEGLPDMWARPYESFMSTVEVGDAVVQRFTFIPAEIVDAG